MSSVTPPHALSRLVRISLDTLDTSDQVYDAVRTANNTALCVSFRQHGAIYAAGDNAGYLTICDTSYPGFLRTRSRLDTGRGAGLSRIAWCTGGPTPDTVALSTYTGGVRTVDVVTQSRLYRATGHAARVRSLAWWQQGAGAHALLTAGGGTVQVHDVRLREAQSKALSFHAHHSPQAPPATTRRTALSAPPLTAHTTGLASAVPVGEQYVVTGGKDGQLVVWDVRNSSGPARCLTSYSSSSDCSPFPSITALSLHVPSGQLAVVGASSDVLVLPIHEVLYPSLAGKAVQGRVCSRGPAMQDSVSSCTGSVACWSPCGQYLASEGPVSSEGRGTVLLWDMLPATSAPVHPSHVLDGHASVLNDVAWTGAGQDVRIATACDDGRVRLYAPCSRELAAYALTHRNVPCAHTTQQHSDGESERTGGRRMAVEGCRLCWTQANVYEGEGRTFTGAGDQCFEMGVEGRMTGDPQQLGRIGKLEDALPPPIQSVPFLSLSEACRRLPSMGVTSRTEGVPSHSLCQLARGWSEEAAWLYPLGFQESGRPRHTVAWAKPWLHWSLAQGHPDLTLSVAAQLASREGATLADALHVEMATPQSALRRKVPAPSSTVRAGPSMHMAGCTWPWSSTTGAAILTAMPRQDDAVQERRTLALSTTPHAAGCSTGASAPRKRLFEDIS